MADLGRAALFVAFGLAVYAAVAGSLAAYRGRRRLHESARNALIGTFAATAVAALVLLLQEHHLAPAVDDLGMMIDAEDARHHAAGIAGELEHREGIAGGTSDAAGLERGGQRGRTDPCDALVLDHDRAAP